jgi:leucyl/phenylalanyl-tRNA--protein transferase
LITSQVELTPESLLTAYRRGIFPWLQTRDGLGEWYSPPRRGVLFLDDLHISRKDMKFIRRNTRAGVYRVTFDAAFADVIRHCAEMDRSETDSRTGRRVSAGQWLAPQFVEQYTRLFRMGYAHSAEVWRGEKLVGGLYGVYIDGVFSGESMFHEESDVNKLAFYALIERLKSRGHRFIDTQMAIGLSGKWGARYVSRESYLQLLQDAQKLSLPF